MDKIQDLTFREGPLLKKFGLSILKGETAGNMGQGTSDLTLIGIIGASDFRNKVLEQRDKVTDNLGGEFGANRDEMLEILRDIRDSLGRIEEHILLN